MIRPQRYFPWKVARHFFFGQFLFVFFSFLIVGFSIRFFVSTSLIRPDTDPSSLSRFDSYLTSLLILFVFIAAVYIAVSARVYVRPLGRLIQRARELRRSDARLEDDVVDVEELNEEPGEWYDLERALLRIHKDLRTKTDALSREREELKALIGAVSDAILAIDSEGQVLFFNSQFAKLFGIVDSASRPGLGISDIFRVPELLQAYRECLTSAQTKIVTASIHLKQQVMPRHFSISIAPLQNQLGEEVHGAIGVFHDVTELKQSEQIRIEFVGNASHELRTPLTSIKGYVETLRGDLRAGKLDEAPQFLDVIARNVDRLILLVNNLLDLSVLDSGGELNKSDCLTREITETVLRQLDPKRAAKRQQIQTVFGVESVHADPLRLEQVILNLVHNAIKYVPDSGTLEVVWENSSSGVVLRVRDNGPGISYEHQQRLFERFYRVDSGRSRDQGGTGLGLAIVKHIMLKHGGSVRVQSRPGEGTEFVCLFPR